MELTAGGETLAKVKIHRGILKGYLLSFQTFVIAMIVLDYILKKCIQGYKFMKFQEKINHILYLDDIKIFAKNRKEMETLIKTKKFTA